MPNADRVSGTPLPGDLAVDVVIVGGGFTGLWTARSLHERDPRLRIAVVEREHVGFGASGRNGGWVSALSAVTPTALATRHGRQAALDAQHTMRAAVDEIGAFLAAAADDAGFHKGGTVTFARTPAQHRRLLDEVAEARSFGWGREHLRWLADAELDAVGRPPGTLAATMTPHCATIHPLRLVHAIARAAVATGAAIYDHTAVLAVEPGRVTTTHGTVRADVVVVATEAYTAALPDRHRQLVPIYSLMVGSEPLSAAHWDAIGLADRPTFNDARNLVIYGQRTADGRIAFGGRGAPYHFGSRIAPGFDTDERVRTMLVDTVRDLYPGLADVAFPFHWGGPLGVPRDWRFRARFDPASGIATAGGYVGDGVTTTYVAGRTLADLITGTDSDLARMPWVGHRSRRWEPEPFRWLGVNVGRLAAARADAAESGSRRTARWRAAAWSRLLQTLTGH